MACAFCKGSAANRCNGCVVIDCHGNLEQATFYCSKECQTADWKNHKAACQSVQARKYLFRAGDLLKDIFITVRENDFDLDIKASTEDAEGRLHIVAPDTADFGGVNFTVPVGIRSSDAIKKAVLSFNAGGDVLVFAMPHLIKKTLNSHASSIEELDVRMLSAHQRIVRHRRAEAAEPFNSKHHVVEVTLRDGDKYILDLAGSQHGQHKPVLPSKEYLAKYTSAILARRPLCASSRNPELYLPYRHAGFSLMAMMMHQAEVWEYVEDEFCEWVEFKYNTSVPAFLKSHDVSSLIDRVAWAAREFAKLARKEPSAAKPLYVTLNTASFRRCSEEEKAIIARKKERRLAKMDRDSRERMQKAEADGTAVMMF